MSTLDELVRDNYRCVACGVLVTHTAHSSHHRILGNRADNRASNKLTLCGSGTTLDHGKTHHERRWARDNGYIVTRHGPPEATTRIPVYYNQPGRRGLFLLGDDYTLTPYGEEAPGGDGRQA